MRMKCCLLYKESSGKLELKEEEQQHAPQTLSRRSNLRSSNDSMKYCRKLLWPYLLFVIIAVV